MSERRPIDALALAALEADERSRRRRRVIRWIAGAVLIVVSVGVFGLGTLGVLLDARAAQQHGPRAEATVLSVQHGRRGDPQFARVRFETGDGAVEADVDLVATRGEPGPGDTMRVAYLRDDPANTAVAVEASMVEQFVVQGAFGLACAAAGTYAGVRLIRHRPGRP
ncbi:MAG: hypothetical protein ACTHN0_15890 [Aquihabitans sp.]